MTVGERIKKVRKEKDLTQQVFADRIGMKRNSIALLESGRNNPSYQTIRSICREFGVREEWLRDGKGSMFISLPKNKRLEQDLRKFLTRENDSFGERLISLLLRLEPSQWEVLERYARELVEKKERRTPDTVEEAEDKYKDSLNSALSTDLSASSITGDTTDVDETA